MAKQALAVKYRPKKFEDVCEQSSIVKIFKNMIENESFTIQCYFAVLLVLVKPHVAE